MPQANKKNYFHNSTHYTRNPNTKKKDIPKKPTPVANHRKTDNTNYPTSHSSHNPLPQNAAYSSRSATYNAQKNMFVNLPLRIPHKLPPKPSNINKKNTPPKALCSLATQRSTEPHIATTPAPESPQAPYYKQLHHARSPKQHSPHPPQNLIAD